VGFKSRELYAQQQACRAAYDQMEASTAAAVGLSSVGPLLYAVTDHATRAFPPELRRIGREHGLQWLGVFRGRNRGYQVLHCADGAAEA
jgi:predicted sugar kinase